MISFTGGCYCGALKYSVEGDPVFKGQCQCRECQYISGGGPNFFVMFSVDAFSYSEGEPKQFTRSDIDNPRTRDFCGTCGTHINTRLPDGKSIVVKVGTMDEPAMYEGPKAAIFMKDAQPFHCIAEGVTQFETRPA